MTNSQAASSPRLRWLGLALCALGLLLLAVLTLSPNGATRQLSWPWWGAWRLLLAVPPLLLGLACLERRPAASTGGVLFIALAGLHAIAAMLGAHPHTSLGAAATVLSAACLFVWLTAWPMDNGAQRIAHGIGAGAALFALISFGSWVTMRVVPVWSDLSTLNELAGESLFHVDWDGVRNDWPLGHSNYTAGVALLTLPWVAFLTLSARGVRRWVWSGATLLVLATLASSGSRGAILGVGAGACVLIAALAAQRRWSLRRILSALAVALVLIGVFVAAIPRARESVAALLAGGGLHSGDQQRLAMLKVGYEMGADRWWIGQGPGLTSRLYPALRHTVDGGVDAAFQLHSTPVQLWADTGLPGVLVAGALLLWAIGAVVRTARDGRGSPWSLAAGTSLAGYAGFALTDYQFDLPVVATLLAVNLACIAAVVRPSRPTRSILAWLALPITALGVLSVHGVPEWRARSEIARAMTALESGEPPAVFDEAMRSASTILPEVPQIFAAAGAAHLRLSLTDQDPDLRALHRESAVPFLEAALRRDPDIEFAHLNLGWLKLDKAPAQAARHFERVIHLAPDRGGAFFALGLARLETGDRDGATQAFALEILNDPIVISSPMWDVEFLAPHFKPAIERATTLADEVATTHRGAADTVTLLRWWQGRGEPPTALRHVQPAGRITPTTEGPSILLAALNAPADRRRGIVERFLLIRTRAAPLAGDVDGILRVLDRCRDDWRAWLQAPEGREPPFVHVYRRERPGYAMLAGNMDFPVPLDAWIVQENRLVGLLFRSIFPAKGHPPDSFLLHHVASRQP